jgi:subtilisin family serine protease
VPAVGETRFLSNEMMFHADPNVPPQVVENAARRLGLSTIDSEALSLTGGTLLHFRLPAGRDMSEVIRELEAEKIGIAQPNYVFKLQQTAVQPPNLAALTALGDPRQYVVSKLRLPEVHRVATGNNVTVAVIDSEIDLHHPELVGTFTGAFDAVGKQDKPHFHGTGMAGAIAAHRTLIGVAPGAHILAVHAFSPEAASAEATTDHIVRGIDWAIKRGARVINMSFAGPDDPVLQVALKKARDKGVILIAAAGNGGPDSAPLYPGADPNVIAVTATDEHDALFTDANRGPYVSVAAPGVDILEPTAGGGYQVTTGTSVAAAHVSGVAALLLERDPRLDEDSLRDILQSSAKHLGANGHDNEFGWGLVDPYRALQTVDAKVAATPPESQRASTRRSPYSSE